MQSKRERKRQRRIIAILLIIAAALFVGLFVLFFVDRSNTNRSVALRAGDAGVQIYQAKKWQDFVIKGLNLSLGSRAPLSKAEYGRFFKRLASLDYNVIRIDTLFPPAFYQALFEYNILTSKPLYLLQGIHLDGEAVKKYRNAYDPNLNTGFINGIKLTIDAIHGNAGPKQADEHGAGKYNLNAAPFVLGFNFLVDEGSGDFVITTNGKNTDVMGFEGNFLYTESATPYEAWLAGMGNFAIVYEQGKYGGPNRLVSWMGWNETDPLAQLAKADQDSDESDKKSENPAAVHIEHIRSTEKFAAGILSTRQLREKFTNYNEL